MSFWGTKDAFTALLDDLARRPLETPELDCFDPRSRFNTERCISGKQNVATEAHLNQFNII